MLWRSLGGAAALRLPESDDVVTLQGLASLVWAILEFPGTESELTSDVTTVLDLDRGGEVSEALDRLIELGFVVPV